MAKRDPRTVIGNVLLLLSFVLVLPGAMGAIGNALADKPLVAAIAGLSIGFALAVIATSILRDVAAPLEVVLTAASIPMLMFGISQTIRQVGGRPAAPILVGGLLLVFGVAGLYFVRKLMWRRIYPRRTQTPSNNRWRGP
jgi:energy-converting hydrogenase Eha subunit C